MDYLDVLARALVAKKHATYGSNWHPLLVLKNNDSGKLYQELTDIVKQFQDDLLAYNFQSKTDFSNLDKLLDSKIDVHYIYYDHKRTAVALDSYSYWKNETKQLIITVNIDLPEKEENFEIAYQLAHLILYYDWDINNNAILSRKMLDYLKSNDFFNINTHAEAAAYTKTDFSKDEIALAYAILLIVPQSELYKVIKRYPENRIDHVANQFNISRRLARFRLQIEQQLPNSILNC